MPSRPFSPPIVDARALMSMNTCSSLGLLVGNVRTTPPCSTTNQRELSFGACSIATGEVNDRFV